MIKTMKTAKVVSSRPGEIWGFIVEALSTPENCPRSWVFSFISCNTPV